MIFMENRLAAHPLLLIFPCSIKYASVSHLCLCAVLVRARMSNTAHV